MRDLAPRQIAVLERLREHGFTFAAFPLYASYIGVKKGNCAALLAPQDGGGMKVYGEPCYLVGGNLSVQVERGGRQLFVWKREEVEATAERLAELERFVQELNEFLNPLQ